MKEVCRAVLMQGLRFMIGLADRDVNKELDKL